MKIVHCGDAKTPSPCDRSSHLFWKELHGYSVKEALQLRTIPISLSGANVC